jgi:DNA-binding CsgD family transcriptional regulator
LHAQAQNLARSAVTELQVTVTTSQASGGWQADSILDYAGLGPRIRLRALCHDGALDDAAAMAQMARLAGSGAQARITPDLPPVLMICDQQAGLVPLQPARPGNGAVCVGEPTIVGTLAIMFGNAWNAATPLMSTIPPAQDVAASSLTAGETALLRLLATGLTDETAARQLGISVRTARRQVAALMDKLGASSRFQAGHMAAQRGWL